ncbi:MAG: hypothetical protein SFW62_07775 [Alphaproteobacteria bacterium]|nr:hypothetical protein [Alphaproteobacteria bacterium]
MAARRMTEAQMVHLVRNALLVAGHEMGEEGDHWPVIKSTIESIMQDFGDLQTELNVHAEMKIHLYAQLEKMEKELVNCSAEVRADAEPKLRELRAVYDAYFAEVRDMDLYLGDDKPLHVKRAEAIIKTLESDNE